MFVAEHNLLWGPQFLGGTVESLNKSCFLFSSLLFVMAVSNFLCIPQIAGGAVVLILKFLKLMLEQWVGECITNAVVDSLELIV